MGVTLHRNAFMKKKTIQAEMDFLWVMSSITSPDTLKEKSDYTYKGKSQATGLKMGIIDYEILFFFKQGIQLYLES